MEWGEDIVPVLLLFLLTMTVSAIVCAFLALRCLQNRRSSALDINIRRPVASGRFQSEVNWSVLDPPRCWAAIRSRNLGAVQDALGLANATACCWTEGLAEATAGNRFFVSPPINGWILVFGSHLPTPSEDVDQCFRFVMNLSVALGEVQYFCANSINGEHAWARAIRGNIVRGYAWHGETLWNQGEFSDAERKTEMAVFSYGESPEVSLFDSPNLYQRNVERIFRLAGRWSVNPIRASQAEIAALGLSGEVSRSRIL